MEVFTMGVVIGIAGFLVLFGIVRSFFGGPSSKSESPHYYNYRDYS